MTEEKHPEVLTKPQTVRNAMAALAGHAPLKASGQSAAASQPGTTSDLSIDETLLLHAIGWEPVDLVLGVSWWSVPWGSWTWHTGELQEAGAAFAGAMQTATNALRDECVRVGGEGVVGVEVELRVRSHHIDVCLSGTAIRKHGEQGSHAGHRPGAVWSSDLSARDFSLLSRSGWMPLGLVAGASFVAAPRRTAGQWASQKMQNAELPDLTNALYQAREGSMSRMQADATKLRADGVVAVKLREGPLTSGTNVRVLQFITIGTAVHLAADGHRSVAPEMVVSLDDPVVMFDATALRG